MATVEMIFITLAVITVFGALVFTLDDLFIDLQAFVRRLKPQRVTVDYIAKIKRNPEKQIAILIANWKEAEIITPMIRGNLRGLEYNNYVFFLGVYPNDNATVIAAQNLQAAYPKKIQVVINSHEGPTSKGQMLNEVARQIFTFEKKLGKTFDLFLMQDSEDVLHPHSLSLLNEVSRNADFVQIPVFSFDVPRSSLVGGVYIDEFAESHTKDLLVREAMGAAVPSAGVGTLLSRHLMLGMMQAQDGCFLKEDTLTEDYHLGMMAKKLGFKSKFACVEYEKEDGKREFIATREYFPDVMSASMRQKSRWTLGIAFQGMENLQWQGSLVDKYFMWRDRRSPFNSILILLSFILLIGFVFLDQENFLQGTLFQALLSLNLFNMVVRLAQRMRAVALTNAKHHVVLVPVRWFVANVVNVGATWKAYRQFSESKKTGKRPVWIKTEHRMPEHFGNDIKAQVVQ